MEMRREKFTAMVMNCSDIQYEATVDFIRKMKILGKKLPNYLDNLLEYELPLAKKSNEALHKWTLFESARQLSPEDEMKLALIHFKGEVQYLFSN